MFCCFDFVLNLSGVRCLKYTCLDYEEDAYVAGIVLLLSLLAYESLQSALVVIACDLFLIKLATVLFCDLDALADDPSVTSDVTDASYEDCYNIGFLALKMWPLPLPKPLLTPVF